MKANTQALARVQTTKMPPKPYMPISLEQTTMPLPKLGNMICVVLHLDV
jgi:hypothetical protein